MTDSHKTAPETGISEAVIQPMGGGFNFDLTPPDTEPSSPSLGDLVARINAAAGDDDGSGATTGAPSMVRESGVSAPPMGPHDLGGDFTPISEETIVEIETQLYLESIKDREVSLREIRDQLLNNISKAFTRETMRRDGDKQRTGADHPKIAKPRTLSEFVCAQVLLARFEIRSIALVPGLSDPDLTLLAIYQDAGVDAGLYVANTALITQLAYGLKSSLTANGAESLIKTLRSMAPVVSKTLDAHLIPLANGIFNRETRELMDFDPKYVFLSKSPVNYNLNATNPVVIQPDGLPWDVESWIDDLSDDDGVTELLWEIISATVRPGERWDQAAFFHSTKGNNGKGTFCVLLRNLLGANGHASIPIAKFGEQFALAELIHARAIIVDENPVGGFSKDLGDFKAVITGDTFSLERKFKNPLSVSFSGMVVQCVNDFPKSRDKSASYTRRQLFVPFRKWFGGDGVERKYIKEDYLAREDVLEYVMLKVLHMDHMKFSNPEACQQLLTQFRRENDPVRDFWEDHEERFVWDMLPKKFLYACFQGWLKKNHPSNENNQISSNDFWNSVRELVEESDRWKVALNAQGKEKSVAPGPRMVTPELFIVEYDLKEWKNSTYSGTTRLAMAAFSTPEKNYRPCLLRVNPGTGPAAQGTDDDAITDEG